MIGGRKTNTSQVLTTYSINSESLGAKPQNEWVKMRVEDDSLKKLSGLGPNVDITKM